MKSDLALLSPGHPFFVNMTTMRPGSDLVLQHAVPNLNACVCLTTRREVRGSLLGGIQWLVGLRRLLAESLLQIEYRN
jgi:hypothetical protein